MRSARPLLVLAALLWLAAPLAAQRRAARPNPKLTQYKQEVVKDIDARADFTAQMVDQIFSYGELGFQEFETSQYLVKLLRDNGFTVQEHYAGIPTAFVATWGSGKPVISLGSDIDDIPEASQYPGVACHRPIVPGAPGHGEGHNSGNPVNITAALAVKKIMERDHLPGTIQIWPGVAEELVGTKAYYVRAGLFKDVDAVLFTSGSAVAAWCEQVEGGGPLAERARDAAVACIGPTTAAEARRRGLSVEVEASTHSLGGLLSALRRCFEKRHGRTA